MARPIRPTPFPDDARVADLERFGRWIRAARTQQGIAIDDAAALCGVSVQLLNALETGRRSVGLDRALHVATQLGLAVSITPAERLPANWGAEE